MKCLGEAVKRFVSPGVSGHAGAVFENQLGEGQENITFVLQSLELLEP